VTHAISDDGGVICAFALAPVVSRVDRVGKEGIEGQPHWLHLNLGNAKARRWLEARTDIPQPARESWCWNRARASRGWCCRTGWRWCWATSVTT
jgi:hypothetical protein